MFKTIKIPIELHEEDRAFVLDLQRQYSIVVRCAYNRWIEGFTEKDIRLQVKSLNNIGSLNSWLVQCAILDAKAVFTRNNIKKIEVKEIIDGKETKTVKKEISKKQIFFGGKNLLNQLHRKLITKEEYKLKRLRPIDIQGEAIHCGNRMFNLDIQNNNSLTFKVSKHKHILINLPKLRTNWLNMLWKLEHFASEKQVTYSIKLTSDYICISFDTKELEQIVLKENRCLGIDMNPEYIGISILEYAKDNSFKIIDKKCFDIKQLTVKSGKSSSHPKSKQLHNKLQFETIEITKAILNIAKSWNCKFVFLEDLNFKSNEKHSTGFNRLTKNKWLRTLFQEQLCKRLDLFNIKHFSVNPVYSSVIGNLQHSSFDPVNAATEVARRGMEVIILKTKKLYPKVWIKDSFEELWKQTHDDSPKVWKDVFNWLKDSKLKYRVSLQEIKMNSLKVLSVNSTKSKTFLYCF